MIVFCSVCKRHVDVGDDTDGMRRFREMGHDSTPVAKLRRGPVGWYDGRQGAQADNAVVALGAPEPDVEQAIVESFKNETRIAA